MSPVVLSVAHLLAENDSIELSTNVTKLWTNEKTWKHHIITKLNITSWKQWMPLELVTVPDSYWVLLSTAKTRDQIYPILTQILFITQSVNNTALLVAKQASRMHANHKSRTNTHTLIKARLLVSIFFRSKLYEMDLKPVCKDCYERLPTHWKRRLAKLHLAETPK